MTYPSIISQTVETGFEAAHRLIDYNGPCKNVHGHSYKVKVTVESPLYLEPMPNIPFDSNAGMAIDFKDLKSVVNSVVGGYDHAYLTCNPTIRDAAEERIVGLFLDLGMNVIQVNYTTTAECIAHDIAHDLMRRLQDRVQSVQVTLWETANNSVTTRVVRGA